MGSTITGTGTEARTHRGGTAELQEKISRSADLEEKLAQAIELAYNRDARYEEMMNKFDLLLNHTNNENRDVEMKSSALVEYNPRTRSYSPPPSSLNAETPPLKKANKATTPQRPQYSVFGKTTSKTSSKHRPTITNPVPFSKQSSFQPLTQPLDTDLLMDTTQPTPGDKTGHQKE